LKILIVEDDEHILSFLKRGFEEDGYIIESALDGEDAKYLLLSKTYDVIIMDWMIPCIDGLELLKIIRKKGIATPTLMLSAKGEVTDKVNALSAGADDYLAKPFSFDELQARVEALYRRTLHSISNEVVIGDIRVDMHNKNVTRNDQAIQLSAKEYQLLLLLIKNKNTMVSNGMIEEQLWSEQEFRRSNIIQVTIYNLRKKLGKNSIKSFRGLGYKLEVQ